MGTSQQLEYQRAWMKRFRQTEHGKEYRRLASKKYYQKHKERISLYCKTPEMRAKACEQYQKRGKFRYQANKERLNALGKLWKERNRDKVRYYTKKRRKLASTLTFETLQMVYEDNIKHYGTLTCYLCKKAIEFGKDSIDHIIPIKKGGTSEYNNLAIAHRVCNSQKSTRTVEQWRELYGRLN